MLIEFGRKDTAFLSKNLKIGRLFFDMNMKKLSCGMTEFRDFPSSVTGFLCIGTEKPRLILLGL